MAATQENIDIETKALPPLGSFKKTSEVVSFYRFVHENNFREETKIILQTILDKVPKRRSSKKSTKKSKKKTATKH